MNYASVSRALTTMVAFAIGAFSTQSLGEPRCKSGGRYAAAASVAANPLYAMYFDLDLGGYLAKNRAQFREGGDAVRCLQALSRGFMSTAIKLYDPADIRRRQELDGRMRAAGIDPGPQQASASSMMYFLSLGLGRLARVLPAAADGDFGPMNTPTNEIEEMQLVAERLLRQLLPPGMFKEMLAPHDELMRAALEFDHDLVLQAAQRLATAE